MPCSFDTSRNNAPAVVATDCSYDRLRLSFPLEENVAGTTCTRAFSCLLAYSVVRYTRSTVFCTPVSSTQAIESPSTCRLLWSHHHTRRPVHIRVNPCRWGLLAAHAKLPHASSHLAQRANGQNLVDLLAETARRMACRHQVYNGACNHDIAVVIHIARLG